MSVDWQTVDVKFTEGQDTQTHPKLVVPGKWRELINMTLSQERTPKMRPGLSIISTTTGHGLFTRDTELLTVNGPNVSSVSSNSTITPTASGRLGYVGISKTEIRRSTGFQDTPDCASGGGYTCYAWREKSTVNAATGISLTLVDESTGTHVIGITSLRSNASVFGVRTVYTNGSFYIFYIDGTSLYCRVIDTGAPTVLGAETALVTSASLAAINFDACVNGAFGVVFVYYGWADGVTSTRVIVVSSAAAIPSIVNGPTNITTQANLPVANITALCCCAFSSNASIGLFVQSTGAAALSGIAGAVIDSFAVVTRAAAVLSAGVGATTTNTHLTAVQDSTRLRLFWDYVSERGTNVTVNLVSQVVEVIAGAWSTFSGPTNIAVSNCFSGAANIPQGARGPWIHGKAYISGGRVLLPVYVESVTTNASLATSNPRTNNAQNTFFVLDTGPTAGAIVTGVVVAAALRGSYGVASINATAPPIGTPCSSPEATNVNGTPTGNFITLSGELTLLVITSTAINVSPTGLVRLTMSPNTSRGLSKAQLGESAYVASGALSAYDGGSVVEQGFELYPEGVAVIANGAGTGSVTDGTHQICVIYEWVDNAGQRHQSAPSPAIQITIAAGPNTGSFTVRVPTLQLSQKTNVQVVAYMTQASGVTFNRVLLDNGAYAPVLNTTASNFVTLTIDDSDATIAGNELLYSQPNNANTTLPNIAPSPCSAICVAHNRLWFDVADQQNAIGYSQEYLNNVGLQFNPALGDRYDANGGTLINIAAMDEKIILLCARKLFVIFGQGPQTSGAFSSYTHPEEIQSDVGCLDARSVLKVPDGILFKASKGWCLLGRDLSVKYIGEGAAYSAYGQTAALGTATIQAAVLLDDRHECRFVINSTANYALTFGYRDNQWSSFQVAGITPSFTDAVWWPTIGAIAYTSSSLGVVREDSLLTVDVLSSLKGISWTATTSFFHLSSLEGFQRVRRFLLSGSAQSAPAGGLTFSVFYDDEPTTQSYVIFSDFSLITFPSLDAVDFRHRFHTQKCKSVALKFVWNIDAFSAPAPMTGIQALALEVGVKSGVRRLPATQTVA